MTFTSKKGRYLQTREYKNIFAISLISFVCVLSISTASTASQKFNSVSWRSTMRSIGLSPEQLSLVEDLVYSHQKKEIERQANLEKLRLELNRQVLGPTNDENLIMSTLDKIGQTETNSKKAHIKLMLGIKKVISPKQFDQFIELSKSFFTHQKKE